MSAGAGGKAGGKAEGASGASARPDTLPPPPRATSVIVIGMAGSGKSTFVSRLTSHLGRLATEAAPSAGAGAESAPTRPYVINIDPAVSSLGYSPSVDIRDTVDYSQVMDQYNLGPNGGILTALNLFTTKFDQVLEIVERRADSIEHVVLDTPGQIEIFTWSASGSIITDSLANTMPTVVAYVVDTPRTTAPATFMSNMLYACSILYKTRLPFVLVFNKTDVQSPQFALDWMHDFETFQQALAAGNATDPSLQAARGADAPPVRARGEEPSYMNSLMNSMSLVLDEFYKNLRAVGVSSATGEGMDEFLDAVQAARREYLDEYRPQLERMLAQRAENREKGQRAQLERLMKDMRTPRPEGLDAARRAARPDPEEQEEEVGEPQYPGDGELLDPDSDEERPEPELPRAPRSAQRWNQLDGSYWPAPP